MKVAGGLRNSVAFSARAIPYYMLHRSPNLVRLGAPALSSRPSCPNARVGDNLPSLLRRAANITHTVAGLSSYSRQLSIGELIAPIQSSGVQHAKRHRSNPAIATVRPDTVLT